MPSELNPRTKEYEWGGPIGAFFMVISLPLTVIGLNAICTPADCSMNIDTIWRLWPSITTAVAEALPMVPRALKVWVLWIAFHWILYLWPTGERKLGMQLRNGKTLTYHINAIHAMVASYALVAFLHHAGIFNLAELADLFMPLALASLILSVSMSALLYVASFRSSSVLLALGGNSGNPIYDFFVGRELNPRIGRMDLKFMFELRPGLIGWTLINWGFAMKAHQNGTLEWNLLLCAFFQTWYVADGLWFEAGNCTMMDIVHDGFGFMLAVGDISWVPFLYTLQCHYMFLFPTQQTPVVLAGCIALQLTGYTLFRTANTEKDRFRRDPKDPRVAHLKIMKTSAGKSLIVSGAWGICRHPNYVGDWIMTVAQSSLAGCGSLLPYFQPVYFAMLLIHRQWRDEHQMQIKYGDKDWKEFCKRVPYRLIPGLY